jgi:hypothetical protein
MLSIRSELQEEIGIRNKLQNETQNSFVEISNLISMLMAHHDSRIAATEIQTLILGAERDMRRKWYASAFGQYAMAIDSARDSKAGHWRFYGIYFSLIESLGKIEKESIRTNQTAIIGARKLAKQIRELDSSVQGGSESYLEFADSLESPKDDA